MHQGKSYSAHSSFIHSMELFQDILITSSVSDECLFKWKLNLEEHNEIAEDVTDAQIDVISKLDFTGLIYDVLPIRNELMDIQMQCDEAGIPDYEIIMKGVIGRKAFAAR